MSNTVPEGWTATRLEKISEHITKGATPTTYGFDWVDSGVLFLRSECVKESKFSLSGAAFISEKAHATMKRSVVRGGDILITITGYIGKCCLFPLHLSEGNINQHIARIRVANPSLAKYVMYFLNSDVLQREFQLIQTGQAYPQLSLKQLQDTVISLPTLPEQQKIAAILSSVDNVIETTRARIDKLKDLKTGMMQELLTKGIGSGGVPHTEFKDSPVGRIPSSWNVRSLGALSSFVTSGSRGWAQYYSSSGAIFIRIGNLTREHINLRFDDTVYVTPPASAEGKRTQVTIGDVLISITADLGVIGVVNESIGDAFVNQHISLVRLSEPALARWVGYFLAFENSQKQFIANNDAGAKAGLNLTAIRKTLVAIPAKGEREKIVASLDSVEQDVSMKRDRLQRLMNLKKALMQDLLTGKVRVNVDQKEPAVA